MTESLRPETIDDVVTVIATARAAGEPVCFRGSGSQLDALPSPTGTPVSMMGLSGVVDQNLDGLADQQTVAAWIAHGQIANGQGQEDCRTCCKQSSAHAVERGDPEWLQ